jgi:hypothetical protein
MPSPLYSSPIFVFIPPTPKIPLAIVNKSATKIKEINRIRGREITTNVLKTKFKRLEKRLEINRAVIAVLKICIHKQRFYKLPRNGKMENRFCVRFKHLLDTVHKNLIQTIEITDLHHPKNKISCPTISILTITYYILFLLRPIL